MRAGFEGKRVPLFDRDAWKAEQDAKSLDDFKGRNASYRRSRATAGAPLDLATVLAFESEHEAMHRGKKADLIRKTFGVDATRYQQALNRFIDSREALELDAALVNRLRDARQRRLDSYTSRAGMARRTA